SYSFGSCGYGTLRTTIKNNFLSLRHTNWGFFWGLLLTPINSNPSASNCFPTMFMAKLCSSCSVKGVLIGYNLNINQDIFTVFKKKTSQVFENLTGPATKYFNTFFILPHPSR